MGAWGFVRGTGIGKIHKIFDFAEGLIDFVNGKVHFVERLNHFVIGKVQLRWGLGGFAAGWLKRITFCI